MSTRIWQDVRCTVFPPPLSMPSIKRWKFPQRTVLRSPSQRSLRITNTTSTHDHSHNQAAAKPFEQVFSTSKGDDENDPNQAAAKSLEQVFSMSKGDDEKSYSKNSNMQRNMTAVHAMPRLDEGLQHVTLPPAGEPIVVADLGCSSGPNALTHTTHIVKVLHARLPNPDSREFQLFFNDLPSNDFNTLFRFFSSGLEGNVFAAGVPGSYFGRLFPSSGVHVFSSTVCLQFLSKIPDEVYDKTSPAFNGDLVHIDGAPAAVEEAFKKQAATDLDDFLQVRAAELAPGGLLFFFAKGRGFSGEGTRKHFLKDDCLDGCFTGLASAWKSLESKGLLTKEQTAAFNLPVYFRTLDELKEGVSRRISEFRALKVQMTRPRSFSDVYSGDLNEIDRIAFCKAAGAVFIGGFGSYMESIIGKEKAHVYWDEFHKVLYRDFEQLRGNTNMYVVTLIRR